MIDLISMNWSKTRSADATPFLFLSLLKNRRKVSVRATTTTTKVERREESDYLP